MEHIGAFEAKNRLGSLLDRVEKGEEIVITRHGKPVARLIREEKRQDQAAIKAAMETLLLRRRDMNLDRFDWQSWKSYRDEGRR